MKKTMILAVLALATSTLAWADEYKYLTVTSSSSEYSIELPTIQRITFVDNNVVVTTSSGDYTYPINELQKMTFTVDPTAIDDLPEQSKQLSVEKGNLHVKGSGMLRIYSSQGALLQMAQVKDGARISLENLPRGVYVITLDKQTIKLSK